MSFWRYSPPSSKPPLVPWVPSREEVIEELLEIIRPTRDDVFYDIGCGDGRVVVSVAKRFGIRVKCVELREDLIKKAMERAKQQGVDSLIEFIQNDFFQVDLSDATIVYMYLLTSVNAKLRPKLEEELKEGVIVISLDFPITNWRPVAELELKRVWQRTLYLYVKGVSDKRVSGENACNMLDSLPPEIAKKLNISYVKTLIRRTC